MSSEPESETFPTVVFEIDNSQCMEVLNPLDTLKIILKRFFLLVAGINERFNAKGF